MKPQNELALIVAYYLARLDKQSHVLLRYETFNQAAREIGKILDVKPNTVKNMRDEFDNHLENSRIGWKRELRGSRLKVLKTFQMTDDDELLQIVKEVLENKNLAQSEEYNDIRTLLTDAGKAPTKAGGVYVLRGPTGKAAEEYFMNYFQEESASMKGDLVDCRDLGCGYDFKVESPNGTVFFEVKGLAKGDGGILFTDKEWQTAIKHKQSYYLVIVRNISSEPVVTIIQNPASKLKSKRSIHTTIQLSWSISDNALKNSES